MAKVKELKIPIVQIKYTGKEPTWEKFKEKTRKSAVLVSFAWYNYHFDYKMAADLVSDYLLHNGRMDEHKLWKRVPSRSIQNGIGWYARMITMGYPATKAEVERIGKSIAHALTLIPAKMPKSSEVQTEENAKKKANIQEIMKERADLLGGDLEYMLDLYLANGAVPKHKIAPISAMKIANILPQHIPDLVQHWEYVKAEFKELYAGKDPELNEAYDNKYTKIQLRNIIKFTDLIISDLNSYVTFKKASRAAPKRKVKTPAQQVMKLKYLKEFSELKIKSVKAEKIIGSKEMFVYSTKKRKLHHYVADESAGSALMVKNNTIIGFDPNLTRMKTVRNPKKQIADLMKASRPGTRKMFKGIRTVEAKVSGRFADDLVILKVF